MSFGTLLAIGLVALIVAGAAIEGLMRRLRRRQAEAEFDKLFGPGHDPRERFKHFGEPSEAAERHFSGDR